MTTQDAISSVVGVLVSLFLHIPLVRRWWNKKRGKVLLLLGFHIGSALAIWAIACLVGIDTGLVVECNTNGLARLGWTGTLGFVSNQATYGLTEYGIPAAQQAYRRIERRKARNA